MSNAEVVACLDQMEAWLKEPSGPSAEALEAWNLQFSQAAARAERGEAWPAISERAHALGRAIAMRTTAAVEERDRIRAEMDGHALGQRALKGYGSTTR